MRKRLLTIILMIIIFTLLSSCVNMKNDDVNEVNDTATNNTDKIQLWYYIKSDSDSSSIIIKMIVDKAVQFCTENNIPLETHEFSSKTLSYSDYILKRNLEVNHGNAILIDDIDSIRDLAKYHADYSKINNYNKLYDVYKDRFCIPLATAQSVCYIENNAMEYYGLKPEKPLITYLDYLKIKQEMKNKGAKFELNRSELFDTIRYYQYVYGISALDEKSDVFIDKQRLKKTFKKSVIDILTDLSLYYDSKLELVNDTEKSFLRPIHDKNSGLDLENYGRLGSKIIIRPEVFNNTLDEFSDKTLYFPYQTGLSLPHFFMHKKITNERIYELANYIVSEDTYMMISNKAHPGSYTLPVFKIDKLKEFLEVNDNLEFIGTSNPKVKEIINLAYEMLYKDEVISKELADNHFKSYDYQVSMYFFIIDFANEVARKLSGDALSLENFDPMDEEINKLLDKRLDEFIANFSIRYD